MYANHNALIIKLTAKYICKLLHKLRSPQKHDDVNNAIHQLLDTYTRLYITGQTATAKKRKKKGKKKKAR
ncbi:MAG: mdtC domain protein [Gammaproteobacteria bacterium]|nr:mdtC domain protein [Gammaproteobacteria bacterium]